MKPTPFTACLAVASVADTLDFYESLGFGVTRESIAAPHSIHMITNGDVPLFMIQPMDEVRDFCPALKSNPMGASGFFYINAPDFEATVARIRDKVEVLIESTEGGFKLFYFKDINGYVFGINDIAG